MREAPFVPPEEDIVLPMPVVTLWFLLVEPYRIPLERESGLVLPDEVQSNAKFLTICGQVRAMGEQAFQKPSLKDSNNPKVGDWVIYGMYGGSNIEMADGRRFVVLADDHVIAKIEDPSMLRHYV